VNSDLRNSDLVNSDLRGLSTQPYELYTLYTPSPETGDSQ